MQMHMSRLVGVPLLLIVAACTARQESQTTTDTAAVKASANAPATDEAAVRRALDSASARFIDAMVRRDTASAFAMYEADAIVMLPNESAWRGVDAVRKGFSGMLSQVDVKDGHFTTDDVLILGDVVLETGRYELTLVPKGGKEIKDKGKYLTAWKRQPDGSLKILRDISNSDLPANK